MLKNFRIGFAYLRVFLRRQAEGFSQPLKPTPFKIGLGLFLLFVSALAVVIHFQNQLFHHEVREGLIGIYSPGEYPGPITNLISKGLFSVDPAGRIQPGLASSIDSNPEGTIFTARLKDNQYWIDGSKIKSSEIHFNFPDVEVSYPTEQTIRFKLKEPYTPFPSLLTKPVYKSGTLVGVGPYYVYPMADVPKGPYSVRKVVLHSAQKELADVTIFMYPSENVAKQALKLGEIQSIIGVSDVSDYPASGSFKVFSQLNPTQIVAIFYNTKDPVLSDENFRLSLSFAAPSISGETEAKTSIPSSSWVFNNEVKDYLENPAQAENYLNKVEKGKDQIITLTTTNFLSGVGNKVVAAWAKLGIKAQVKVESGIPQNFQALLIAQNIPLDPDQYSLWHSTQTQTNITKISNPRIDKDLEDGRKATDSAKRKTAYQDFQKVLLDHSPATFLYFPKINVVYNKKVEDELTKVLALQLGQR